MQSFHTAEYTVRNCDVCPWLFEGDFGLARMVDGHAAGDFVRLGIPSFERLFCRLCSDGEPAVITFRV